MGVLESVTERPCDRCGSMGHSPRGHLKLEQLYRRLGIGWVGMNGPGGAPLLSDLALETPARLRIVPCTIGLGGPTVYQLMHGPAISCVLKPDDSGVSTFMLWCALTAESHEKVSGAVGSGASVGVQFGNMIRISEPATM